MKFILMKYLLCLIVLLNVNNIAYGQDDRAIFLRNIRCLTCSGQSIYDSNSDFAVKLRGNIDKMIASGINYKDIESKLVAEYGPQILMTSNIEESRFIWYLPHMVMILLFLIIMRISVPYIRSKTI